MAGGTLQFDTITDSAGTGAPNFPNGIKLNGSATIVGNASPSLVGVVTSYVPVIRSATDVLTSASGTSLATDGFSTYEFSTGGSNQTLTVPSVTVSAGRTITLVKTDSGAGNVSIVNPDGSLTGPSPTLYTQNATSTIYCDGTNWITIVTPIQETTFTATFTQSGGYSQPVSVKITKIARLVQLEIPQFTGTTTAAAAILSGATDIPSWARPAIESRQGAIIANGASAVNTGGIYFTITGQIQVYVTPAGNTFTSGVTGGLGAGGTSTTSYTYKATA